MRKKPCLLALAFLIAAFLCLPGHSQVAQKTESAPSTLDEYHFVARGRMSGRRGANPQQIVRMDNNGEILLACVEAKTAGQLASSGLKFAYSQMELLTDWNLLAFDRKTKSYRTTIHVYGPEKAPAIRGQVHSTVLQLAGSLDTDLASLKSHLQKTGQEKSLFTILYAYILHAYSMSQFRDNIYLEPQLSAENPFWNGFAWAVYPIRKFDIGVATLPGRENQFFFVSSNAVPGPNVQQMMSFVEDVSTDSKVDDPELKKSFSDFGLCNTQGELTVLDLDRDWTAKLEGMAKKVYTHTIALADSPEMKALLGMETQAQAAMFLHYELRYAFLSHSLETGLIETPIDFDNPDNNSPLDKRNLVFMIRL